MNEKPIILKTEEVRAILDGRKTMFRVPIKPQPHIINGGGFNILQIGNKGPLFPGENNPNSPDVCWRFCPYKPGDVLWVRETWNCIRFGNGKTVPYETEYWYKADEKYDNPDEKWRSSTQMPRVAARIFLLVKSIRVERLRDITEEDAKDEGIGDPYEYQNPDYYEQPHMRGLEINQSAFAGSWDARYAKKGFPFESNCYVWVVEFERTGVREK